jgi:hypothetical protein
MEMDGQSLIGREFCGKMELDRGEIEGVGQTAEVANGRNGDGHHLEPAKDSPQNRFV